MIPQNKKHFTVLVHYGEAEVTNKLLKSLGKISHPPDLIVVVDNCQNLTPLVDSRVNILKPQRNLGYAGGFNFALGVLVKQGLRSEDIITIINNDAVPERNAYRILREYWDQRNAPALLGCASFDQAGRKVSYGQVNLFTGRAVTKKGPKNTVFKISRFSKFHQMPYMHGALLSASASVWLQLKGIPPNYFLYWEDVLLSCRARQLSIPQLVNQQIVINHDSHKPQPSSQHLYYLVRNGAMFLEQETPQFWRVYWWVANRLRLVFHFLRQNKTIFRPLCDAVKNKQGVL